MSLSSNRSRTVCRRTVLADGPRLLTYSILIQLALPRRPARAGSASKHMLMHAPYWPGLTGCDSLPHSLLPRGQPTNRSLGVGRRDLDLLVSPEVSRMHYPKCRTAGRQTAFPLSRRNRASRLWHHSFVPNPRSRTLSN